MGKLKAPERSYAIIQLSSAAYVEICDKLLVEGLGDHIRDEGGSIDMHGIILESPAHPNVDLKTSGEPKTKEPA